MIPAGRDVVDVAGIAKLHGLSLRTARKRNPLPWKEEGHPEPLMAGKTAPGRPLLWDRAQAAAFARGEPVPDLPAHVEHDEDLFDDAEAAELVGLPLDTWSRYRRDGKVPPADVTLHGADFRYRRTIERFRQERAERADTPHGGGRPPGRTESKPRAEVAREIRELVESGETNTAEIARRVGVAYTTAANHVKAIAQAQK